MSKAPIVTLSSQESAEYVLELYITGATEHSTIAVRNIKQVCEEYLAGRYSLEIIDVYQQPILAERMALVATPTLVKLAPKPAKRLIGDMADKAALLAGLNINL